MRGFGFPKKRASALSLLCLAVVAALTVPAQAQQIPYKPITPFDVPGNAAQSQLSTTQLTKARSLFAGFEEQPKLTAGSPLHTLSQVPTVPSANDLITLRSGQRIDTRALYLFLNAVEKSLNQQGKTLRDPNITNVDLDRLQNLQIPSTQQFGPQIPTTGVQESTEQPPQVTPTANGPQTPASSPSCNATPRNVDLDRGWSEINQLLDGASVSRCSLDFAAELDSAESQAPVVPDEVTVASLTLGNTDPRNFAQAYLQQKFTYNASDSELEFTSTLAGAFMGKSLNVGSIDAKVTAPKGSVSTGVVDIKLGNTTAYNTSGSWKDLSFNLAPDKSTPLFDPWVGNFQIAPGINASFEVNAAAKYGLNGHIKTYKTAAYLDFKPNVEVDVTGGLKVSAIIVSGGLDGTLALISGDGDFGGVVAVFPDTTKSASNPPLIGVVGPVASYSATALQGELHAYVRVALIGTVFSKKIMTWNGKKLAQKTIPTFWSVYNIAQ
jgi:hypothetical protein